jgi:2-(1,2-epoxy-1,2-dihydrophenyl)acetyl-CoA isomerase
MYEFILYEELDGVAKITLNRPEVINAIHTALGQELYAALKQVEANSAIRAVVLTGAGRGFCSGQDLGDRVAADPSLRLADSVRERYNLLITKIHTLHVPVIAAVKGVAAGAGFGLALACDIRFASSTAKFTMAFSKIGLVPDSGSSYFLPRIVGTAKALELAWTADVINAEEALRLGIVNRVFDPEVLLDETMAFAKRLAEGPTLAYQLTKQAIHANTHASLAEALEREAVLQDIAGRSHDFREGVRAFAEKRSPKYEGR